MSKISSNIKESILKAMSVVESSLEGARYLATQVEALVAKTKSQERMGEVVHAVKDFVTFIQFKFASSSQSWRGEVRKTSEFANMHEHRAKDAAASLKSEGIQDVGLYFAINDQAQFVRGYAVGGVPLDPLHSEEDAKTVKVLDKPFNAFLAERGVIVDKSILYKVDKEGKVMKDADKNPIKANPEEVSKWIAEDFPKFSESNGINLACYNQSETRAAEVAPESAGMRTGG